MTIGLTFGNGTCDGLGMRLLYNENRRSDVSVRPCTSCCNEDGLIATDNFVHCIFGLQGRNPCRMHRPCHSSTSLHARRHRRLHGQNECDPRNVRGTMLRKVICLFHPASMIQGAAFSRFCHPLNESSEEPPGNYTLSTERLAASQNCSTVWEVEMPGCMRNHGFANFTSFNDMARNNTSHRNVSNHPL